MVDFFEKENGDFYVFLRLLGQGVECERKKRVLILSDELNHERFLKH